FYFQFSYVGLHYIHRNALFTDRQSRVRTRNDAPADDSFLEQPDFHKLARRQGLYSAPLCFQTRVAHDLAVRLYGDEHGTERKMAAETASRQNDHAQSIGSH